MDRRTPKKFFILLWKNLIIKRRHWLMSILEIVIPTILFMAIVALRAEGGERLNPVFMNETTYPKEIYPLYFCKALATTATNGTLLNSTLVFYPDTPDTNKIMGAVESAARVLTPLCVLLAEQIGINLSDAGTFSVIGVNDSSLIETMTNENSYNQDTTKPVVFGGVVFENMNLRADGSQPDLDYTLRLGSTFGQKYSEFLFFPYQFSGPQPNGEQYNVFSAFQTLIDLSYTQLVTGVNLLVTTPVESIEDFFKLDISWIMSEQEMPYPSYFSNNLSLLLGFIMPLFLVLSFSFIVPPLLKRIVYEKETGVKELMKMMGLPSWMHWICWFINCIGVSTISIIIMVILVSVEFKAGTGAVLDYSNPFLVFLFLFLYASSLICFLFIISTLFDRPNLALSFGVLVHILSYIIPNSSINKTSDSFANYSFEEKMLMALIPNINLIWGIKMLMASEGKGTGLQFSTLFSRARPGDPLTMGAVWIMFLVDIAIYSLIIAYIDKIAPGKFGVAEKWYFPFTPEFWCSKNKVNQVLVDDGETEMKEGDSSMFETEPQAKAGIQVHSLRKEFKKFGGETVKAVNGVSFSAYNGEITTLLGHNGAGKTTTMSVLTGLYSPTSGSAMINGHSISSSLDKVRESLGLCPQHNMLFEDLTVREHLVFFGMLKGMSKADAEHESEKYTSMLNLVNKRNVIVTNLSGGMKRKVNLGIALIGDSKVVMLDEPTSGMDPEARRGMWDLLTSLKKDRTILLTTHFMEEADVLGDRIAIMARGKVQCYGTPFFLKNRFGSGYSLHLTKENIFKNIEKCSEIISQHISGPQLESDNDDEAVFRLPTGQSSKFPDMFLALEKEKASLGIANFGLDLTTMDDVFLKIGELQEKNATEEKEIIDPSPEIPNIEFDGSESGSRIQIMPEMLSGFQLVFSQLKGLLAKRMIYSWRRKSLYIFMMAIPVAMAVLTVLSLNPFTGNEREHPYLRLELSGYDDPVTFVGSDGSDIANSLNRTYGSLVDIGTVVYTDDINNKIINMSTGGNNLATYKDTFIVAADFEQSTNITYGNTTIPLPAHQLTALYNSVPLHSRPLAHNYVSNTLLTHLEMSTSDKHSINIGTHPLPEPRTQQFDIIAQGGVSFITYGYGISFPLGLAILVSSFLIFPLSERATNAKQVQIMTGLHPGVFWASNVLWDMMLYIISGTIMFACILGLDKNETFLNYGAWGAFLIIIILLGSFGTPFSYVFSFMANNAASGFALLIIINILAGCIAPTAVFMLRDFGSQFDSQTLIEASDIVRWIFNWFPIFPFTRALMAITTVQEANNLCVAGIQRETLQFICKKYTEVPELILANKQYVQCCMDDLVDPQYAICGKNITVISQNTVIPGTDIPCHEIESFYTWDPLRGINLDMLMLCVDGCLFFLILVLIETKILYKLLGFIKERLPGFYTFEKNDQMLDNDVQNEQERVNHDADNDILKVFGLQKKFRRLEAVKELSFGVKSGECFGLLGINGAGKTTTFRMLTGDETASKGNASILSTQLNSSRRKFLQQIGYCPQFDSIIPQLTGKELLTLMCRVRGVQPHRVEREVQRWTHFLGIQEYIERESGSYSGGNKRKLNVAMALVGEPPLIFLDEPSTGVDPVARRNLWKIIKKIQMNGQSVVLTSHSMEECEALCDRLAIMVNGQFQCFGTNNHLKNKFAQGFTILTKLKASAGAEASEDDTASKDAENANQLKEFVSANLTNVEVKDEHKVSFIYQKL